MVEPNSGQTIASVERAADVLTAFAHSRSASLGVTQIAQQLGMSKAVVHRVLTSFRGKGYVQLDEVTRRYSLGPAALALGSAYLESLDVRLLARPRMEWLSEQTHETATLSVRSGWYRTYIDQVTPAREVKMTVELGRPHPLHAGSSSKAFLAYLPEDEQTQFLERTSLDALTPATITDRRQLGRELKRIHKRGYATSEGERQLGASSVAAPLFNHRGYPIAVMSLCGPGERFTEVERFAKLLVEATNEISKRMGFQGTSQNPQASGEDGTNRPEIKDAVDR